MAFPSSIVSFGTKVNGAVIDASDVNSPQTEITAIETKIGVDNSSVVGSITYQLRDPLSNGGGHIQTANKGGTGQTTFIKGDILVATSSSVLGKVSVGTDGQALVADSTQTSGVAYKGVATEKQLQDQTYVYASASVLSASVYGITFASRVSVLSAGQAFEVKWPTTNAGSVLALTVSSLLAVPLVNPDLTNPEVGSIKSSMISRVEYDGVNFQITSNPHNVGTGAKQLVQLDGSAKLPAVDGSALTSIITYKNGVDTYNIATADGTRNIAHGLGKTPKKVKMVFLQRDGANNNVLGTAFLAYNGTTFSEIHSYSNNAANVSGNGATVIIYSSAGTDYYTTGTPTVDATNISLAWVKTNSPTGTVQILWEVEG